MKNNDAEEKVSGCQKRRLKIQPIVTRFKILVLDLLINFLKESIKGFFNKVYIKVLSSGWDKLVSESMSVAVKVSELVKVFGEVKALDGLSLHIKRGEIFGLIGPNGAGKTTALRIISTLLLPTSGSVKVFDFDVVAEALDVRRLITYLPEEAGAYKNLSGSEYLEFMARFTAKNKGDVEKIVEVAEKISGLEDRLRDKVKTYSKGMKRRLLVARALMTKPKLSILDEPTSGLDVLHSVHVRRIIKRYVKNEGVTVLLSSHNMLEVEHLCSSVALINKGKIVAEGSPLELKKKIGVSNLEEVFAKVVGLV